MSLHPQLVKLLLRAQIVRRSIIPVSMLLQRFDRAQPHLGLVVLLIVHGL